VGPFSGELLPETAHVLPAQEQVSAPLDRDETSLQHQLPDATGAHLEQLSRLFGRDPVVVHPGSPRWLLFALAMSKY
jgi:hypothetical protein